MSAPSRQVYRTRASCARLALASRLRPGGRHFIGLAAARLAAALRVGLGHRLPRVLRAALAFPIALCPSERASVEACMLASWM